jgi:hypothetical protein
MFFKSLITFLFTMFFGSIVNASTLMNVNDLRNENPISNSIVFVLGYYEPNDGGGGQFYWDSSSTEEVDGGRVISSELNSSGRWKRIIEDSGFFNVKHFGATGDGATDDTSAVLRAIASIEAMNVNGLHLFFPLGTYRLSETLVIKRPMRISSTAVSNLSSGGTTLWWTTPDIDGIYLKNPDFAGDTDRADGSIIENLTLQGTISNPVCYRTLTDDEMYDGMTGYTGHGIVVRAPLVRIRDVFIYKWRYDGIHATSFFGYENANGIHVSDVQMYLLGRHGIFTAGTNSNGGLFTKILGTSCISGYSIYERGFLGNTYLSPLSEGAAHSYFTSGGVNNTTFLGAYQEASDPSNFTANTTWIGGTYTGGQGLPLLVGTVAHQGFGYHGGVNRSTPVLPFKKIIRGTELGPNSFPVYAARYGLDNTLVFDLTNGNALLILPDPTAVDVPPGTMFTVKVLSGTYQLWLKTLGEKKIENGEYDVLIRIFKGETYTVQSDGTQYWIVSKF